jgi:hypothetical protein
VRFGRFEIRPLGGGLGCLVMILVSIVASVVLTVLLNPPGAIAPGYLVFDGRIGRPYVEKLAWDSAKRRARLPGPLRFV